ncbi:MAG: hypothetical protein ACRBCJ_11200 [Hyphomicrobiaceae bacterium]
MNDLSLWDTEQKTENNSPTNPRPTSFSGRSRPTSFQPSPSIKPSATGHDHSTNPDVTGRDQVSNPDATGNQPDSDHHDSSAPTLPVRTRPGVIVEEELMGEDATGRGVQQRPVIPEGEETMTILQATDYLREKGFDDIKPRSVQRYCTGERRQGQLICYWHDKSQQHLVSTTSLENFAERLANELPKGTNDETPSDQPEPSVPHETTASDPEQTPEPKAQVPLSKNYDELFDHPYVRRLEQQVNEYQEKWETQVKTTEEIQRQHSKGLADMHQQLMIATSKNYADAYLELSNTPKTPSTDDDKDYQLVDEEDTQQTL